MSLKKLKLTVEQLYEKYENDEYILNKLIQYIDQDLLASLINAKNLQITRENRKQLLTEKHDKFVKDFINHNIYFYCSTTEIFFKYNKFNYNIIKEDNIIHDILSTISSKDNDNQLTNFEEQLLPWKFKIKISIIKQIRDKSLFTSIPEGETIQNVINLFDDIFFNNKYAVKHFLTILGDNISKKQSNNIYLISSTAKNFLRLIENHGNNYFGHIPILNSFRYKYHDHDYNECRLINIKNIKTLTEIGNDFYEQLQKNIIDIFVVSCYYSNIYNSADDYLNENQDSDYTNYVLFLKNNNSEKVIDKFIESKIQKSDGSIITHKNMLYLWKCYLDENNLPNILFLSTFKNIIKNKLHLDEDSDTFDGYTSLKLPIVSNFIQFWDETIEETENEDFIEIEELCILFKTWCNKPSFVIQELSLINLIQHFYSNIIIDNNKYIYGIISKKWCKKTEIHSFIKNYREKNHSKDFNIACQSINELYLEYSTKYCKKNKNSIIIGKEYFELFAAEYNFNIN